MKLHENTLIGGAFEGVGTATLLIADAFERKSVADRSKISIPSQSMCSFLMLTKSTPSSKKK